MTKDEEKAEEYVTTIQHDINNWGGKEPTERFYNEIKLKQAYLDGLAEERKEKCIIEQNKDGTIKLCDIAKENAELKQQIEKMKCCTNCKWKGQYRERKHCLECGKVKNKGWELAE